MKARQVRWVGMILVFLTTLVYSQSEISHGVTFPLRDLAAGYGLWLGPAIAYNPLVREPIYSDTLQREFNILTPENDMKWSPIHPQRFRYDFTRADAMVNFAATYGMAVHGHTLVWHSQNPGWLTSGSFSRKEM